MKKLIRRLLERDHRVLSVRETILWWEWRRGPYNLLVGCAGVISIASSVLTALSTKSQCGIPDPPFFAVIGVVLYGLVANVMYTGGRLFEIALRRYIEPRTFARRTFLIGLVFSVLLTISPAFLIPIACTMVAGSQP